MSDWRPIEIAPKDGRWLLLWLANMEGPEHWSRWLVGHWIDEDRCFYTEGGTALTHEDKPTHWMPLPDPPA